MSKGYYHTKSSVEEYIRLAKDVNGRYLITKLNQFLPGGSAVLEIGSGPGTDWEILKEEYQVIGSDNSKDFLTHLRASFPKGVFQELDAVSLNTQHKYDGIYSNKVLHHLTDQQLVKSIKRQFQILNPGGVICHSFWKGNGTEVFKGLFVNYHLETELNTIFGKYFEILLLEEYAEFDDADSVLLIGKKLPPAPL